MPRPGRRDQRVHRISSPYEAPEAPELSVDTGAAALEACVEQVVNALIERGVIPAQA